MTQLFGIDASRDARSRLSEATDDHRGALERSSVARQIQRTLVLPRASRPRLQDRGDYRPPRPSAAISLTSSRFSTRRGRGGSAWSSPSPARASRLPSSWPSSGRSWSALDHRRPVEAYRADESSWSTNGEQAVRHGPGGVLTSTPVFRSRTRA
jgi:hypothetical protein